MIVWQSMATLDRPRATPGRCLACGRPALRDALGWAHVGSVDAMTCALNSTRPVEYAAYERPPLRFTLAALAAAAFIALGAGILSAVWGGLPSSGAVTLGAILYGPTAGAIAVGIRWARAHE